jgi:hypothetical protein
MDPFLSDGRKPGPVPRKFRRRRLYTFIAILTVGGLLALTGSFLFLMRELQRDRMIERELGFKIGTPMLRADGSYVEVIAAYEIQPGGIASRAGIREWEVIIHPTGKRSTSSMFRWLDNNRGYPVSLTVLPGGDGPALTTRPRRTVTFVLPQRVPR